MSIKISKEAIPQIIKMYTVEMVPMKKIAEIFGLSRQGVFKIIRKSGTPTQKGIASRRLVECHNCKKNFELTRARVRERGNNRSFCSRECYDAWLRRNNSKDDRNGSRIARNIVESIYGTLPEGSIVHHIDGNGKNNNLSNLILLKSQADHIRLHRETDNNIIPLFVGADVVLPSSSSKFSFHDAGKKVLFAFKLGHIELPSDFTMLQIIQFLIAKLKTSQTMNDIKKEIRKNFGCSQLLEDIFKDPNNYIAF